jgi:glucan phosphoethanolaminetransferase (alkaline phosphatase superfamily)
MMYVLLRFVLHFVLCAVLCCVMCCRSFWRLTRTLLSTCWCMCAPFTLCCAMLCCVLQVVLAPDPDLAEHLLVHGVMVSTTSTEGDRLQRAFLIQVCTCSAVCFCVCV